MRAYVQDGHHVLFEEAIVRGDVNPKDAIQGLRQIAAQENDQEFIQAIESNVRKFRAEGDMDYDNFVANYIQGLEDGRFDKGRIKIALQGFKDRVRNSGQYDPADENTEKFLAKLGEIKNKDNITAQEQDLKDLQGIGLRKTDHGAPSSCSATLPNLLIFQK